MLSNYRMFRDNMILRDHLALDRTVLANERTLLAYVRTFIGTLSAGVAMIKLLDNTLLVTVAGYALIIVSPFFLIFGAMRYANVYKKLRTLKQKETAEEAESNLQGEG